MASVSGATSSLGNTSLRGYGGLASGIDRDAIIEQMTAGTNAKITKQKNAMTSLSWKQEAYQSISNKMLDLQDNFLSYSSGSNLKDASIFAKNRITVLGKSDVTKYVTATGTSNMTEYLSILGVSQTATAATTVSGEKDRSDIGTNISNTTDKEYYTSNLQGTNITFGYLGTEDKINGNVSFTFPSSYKDGDGKYHEIHYTSVNPDDPGSIKALVDELNKALEYSDLKLGEDKISDAIKFEYDEANGNMKITKKDTWANSNNFGIVATSSVLGALGFDKDAGGDDKVISFDNFNSNTQENAIKGNTFAETYIKRENAAEYLAGKKFTISLGGQKKEIELLSKSDLSELGATPTLEGLKDKINENLKSAFGTAKDSLGMQENNVKAEIASDGKLVFTLGEKASESNMTLTMNISDVDARDNLGMVNGASNKLSLDASIKDNMTKLGLTQDDLNDLSTNGFKINGVTIQGITEDTTINELMDKINSNKEVGVKAQYLSSSNQFVLVATESGNRGEIDLGNPSSVADGIFGTAAVPTAGQAGEAKTGENAKMLVSYGNGVTSTVESFSNTFDISGLQVTVSGKFGDVQADGTSDLSQAVTFSASADVDGVTEKVKKFIEDYNEMVKEINTQVTTKPDKSYGPLTDEQKDEMSETSIENWEKKAKQGLLFNDATMRELSMSIQNVMTELLGSGVTNEDLEEMGITISDDYSNGGEIIFNESKFKDAMTNDPEKIADIFTGGGDVKKGLSKIVEDTLTPYANRLPARNGNTYGRLIEEAGSEKLPLTISNNQIYKELKDMEENITTLRTQLKTEQDRYISQFTRMETMINQMNSQASYLSQLQA